MGRGYNNLEIAFATVQHDVGPGAAPGLVGMIAGGAHSSTEAAEVAILGLSRDQA